MGVTIRDLAEHCGVGRTAVSLALRDAPGVSSATRERVLKAARELGYVGDPVVARLAERRWRRTETSRVALVREADASGPAFASLPEAAMRMGYQVEQFDWGGTLSPGRLGGILQARGFEAVLLDKVNDVAFLRDFPFDGFVSVSLAVGQVRMPVHQVRLDNVRTVEAAWNRCRERGYERIGLLLFDEWTARDLIERKGAFLDLQANASEMRQADAPPYLLVPPEPERSDEASGQLGEWVERFRPDAVIGLNFNLYWRLRELGLAIPEDLGFVGLQNPVRESPAYAWFDRVDTDVVRTGLWLMDRLLRENRRGIPERRMKILLDQVFVDGGSLSPR